VPGTTDNPFSETTVATIPLQAPPLTSVLTQIRFTPVLGADMEQVAGHVQRALRDSYPFVTNEMELGFSFAADAPGPPSPVQTPLWRYADQDSTWRVSIANAFVALETSSYAGHEDFFARLRSVLEVVEEVLAPPGAERVGVRYTQRLTAEEDLERIGELVRPEVLGASAVHADGRSFELCLTQTQTRFDDVTLSSRWGLLPPGAAVDAVIAPLPTRSWVMDLDVFDERREPFSPKALADRALSHSRRQYQFFRWAVQPAFLARFGGDPDLIARLVAQETR
jgi:uncharacterized protein (TIGR04255 family)